MADRHVDVLLCGGGLASANCAKKLRDEGYDGSVLLVGREFDPPYNRPPLSKGYLQGKESREDVLFRPDEWWEEQQIELIVGEKAAVAGKRVDEVALPDGSLIISILRSGGGFVPKADSVIEPGDEVLVVLDPGLEEQVTKEFAADGAAPGG